MRPSPALERSPARKGDARTPIIAPLAGLWRNRFLIVEMTRREVHRRYRGSVFGLLWYVFTPLILIAIYTVVFREIFGARWTTNSESVGEFGVFMFAGLIVFTMFSDCFGKSSGLVIERSSYLKHVVFPAEVVAYVACGSVLVYFLASFLVLILALALLRIPIGPTILLTPCLLVPFVFLNLGISWFMAALGVFIRDLQQIAALITTILLFLSPVFYPVTAVPERYRVIVAYNPLGFIVDEFRTLVVGMGPPNWWGMAILSVASYGIAWAGLAFFRRLRPLFAEVL